MRVGARVCKHNLTTETCNRKIKRKRKRRWVEKEEKRPTSKSTCPVGSR